MSNHTEICYPAEKTYWISFRSPAKLDVTQYDYFFPDQCLITEWEVIELYTVEQEWVDRLAEYDITPVFPPSND